MWEVALAFKIQSLSWCEKEPRQHIQGMASAKGTENLKEKAKQSSIPFFLGLIQTFREEIKQTKTTKTKNQKQNWWVHPWFLTFMILFIRCKLCIKLVDNARKILDSTKQVIWKEYHDVGVKITLRPFTTVDYQYLDNFGEKLAFQNHLPQKKRVLNKSKYQFNE